MKSSPLLFSKRRIHENYDGRMPSRIDGSNVRQQASDKENIRKKPNSGHINPNKKLSELGAAKDNNNDESPIKFMG